MMSCAMSLLLYVPCITGVLLLFTKHKTAKKNSSLVVLFAGLMASLFLFIRPSAGIHVPLIEKFILSLGLSQLSAFILIFINVFGFLICLYSRAYGEDEGNYYSYLVWLIAFSNLVVFAADFITLMVGWGAILILLYLLLGMDRGESAKRALSVVGRADFSLLLGIGMYIAATGTSLMPHEQGAGLALNNGFAWASFVFMLVGALAKAGSGPFHTWIPVAAEEAPVPVMAILPASLDKLLGIYLLARICVDFFVLNGTAMGILLIIGSLTILFAVMMALIQHDLRKLLSFHAISQVGYMVLGFGTGTAIGIAGGLFHMINHALYKTGLFLTGGAVGKQKKTFELSELGGLAAYMPITFACGLIFSLSISGVPPFNGFASKWMLYQGALLGMFAAETGWLKGVYVCALMAAMFGSALTLASFIKFIHATFLGQRSEKGQERARENSFPMIVPLTVLATLCVLLGVFPKFFVSGFMGSLEFVTIPFIGDWNSVLVFSFIAIGLLLGVVIFYGSKARVRRDDFFAGGEETLPFLSFPGTEFYRTVQDVPSVKMTYRFMDISAADPYIFLRSMIKFFAYVIFYLVDRVAYACTNLPGRVVLGASWIGKKMHSGVLDLYLAWCLLGLMILFFILKA